MKISLPMKWVFKRLNPFWTLDSGLFFPVGHWTRMSFKRNQVLKALVLVVFSAVFLSFLMSAMFPESSSTAEAVGIKADENPLEVDGNLILEPGGGMEKKGPLIERALSLASTDEVKGQLEYLLANKRDKIRRALSLSTRYLPYIKPVLEEYGLPKELAYLCIIESGYHLSARSHAGAVGMWQMIRATSRRFDLVTDNWVDDRLDFIRSTEGAARFFLYLKERFDNWDCVLAAYNAGEGRVKKAIRIARRQNLSTDFRNLSLPRETKIYVPAFYAVLLIALQPERYGIFPDYKQPLDFFEIKLPGGVPLATVSKHLGCNLNDLRQLNPSILRDRVPFRKGGFDMRIPRSVEQGRAKVAAESLNEVQYVSYRVRQGDTLWDISRKFGVSMSRISRAGRHKGSPSKIFPGEILLVVLTGGEIS